MTDNEYFSELQFDFREGVGCIAASFIYTGDNQPYASNGGVRCSVASSTSANLLIQFGLKDYFSELGINGRMRLVIKDIYTNSYTDDIIILLNFIFTGLHGYEIIFRMSSL